MTDEHTHRIESREAWGDSIVRGSVSQMLEDCRRAISEGREYEGTINGSFIGRDDLNSIEDAIEKAYIGVPSDVAKVSEWRQSLNTLLDGLIPDLRQKMVYSENRGRQISVRRLLDGEAKFRRGRRRVPVANRSVSIVIDVGMLGGYSTDAGFMRTAAAVAICDLLEQQDIRVEIWGMSRAMGSYDDNGRIGCGRNYEGLWKVKASDAPLNLSTVVAATSAWFFRTIVFQHRHSHRKANYGMGSTVRGTDEVARRLTGNDKAVCFSVEMNNDLERMKESCKTETTRIVEILLKKGGE